MSDKCKELQREILKEVRDINPDPNLLKETRNLMEQFSKVNMNKNVAIHPRAEEVYWNMRNKEKAEWEAKLDSKGEDIDVTPESTYVDFSINGSRTTTSRKVTSATYNTKTGITRIVLDNKYTYSFGSDTRNSKPTKSGSYITLAYDLFEYGIDTQQFNSSKADNTTNSSRNQESKFTKMARNIHKDIGKMKELLHTLNDLDPVKASPEHLNKLSSLFDMIDPKFLKNVNYFLNKESTKNKGSVEGNELKLNIKNSNRTSSNEQSMAEVYAHEVLHTMLGYATKSKDPEAVRIIRELYHVMDIVRKSIRPKHLISDTSIDPVEEMKIAKEQLDYVFNNKTETGLDEFISHGLTNELWMKRLGEIVINSDSGVGKVTLLDKLVSLVRQLFNRVTGKEAYSLKGKDAHTALLELSLKLAEYNNRSINRARSQESAISKIGRLIEDTNGLIVKAFEKVGDVVIGDRNVLPVKPPESAGTLEKAKYYSKMVPRIMTDPRLRGVFQTALSSIPGLSPEGFVQNVIRDFKDPTKLERLIEKLGSQSDTIDRVRNTMIKTVQDSIMEGFSRPLTDKEQVALTSVVLELDIESLKGKYSNSELIKLLSDEDYLNKSISRAKHNLKLADTHNYNWNVNQANGLGYYLATHKAGIAQNLNSVNIARGLLTETYRTPTKNVVMALDEVSTLVGIKYTNKLDKSIVANLIKTEPKGIKNILEYHKGFKKESRDKLFKSSITHTVKGYVQEIFDDTVDIKIVPLSQSTEMRNQGYEFISEVTKHSKDRNTVPMGLYRSKLGITQQYYRSATRLTNLARKGTSLTEINYKTDSDLAKKQAKRDIAVMNQARRTVVRDMEKGELDVEAYAKDVGLVPLMNQSGKVIDYRYMMSKENKLTLLDQDKGVAKVIGKMVGSVYDKTETEIQNDKVLDLIIEDMDQNYIPGLRLGKNNHEYIKISADSDLGKVREIYSVLPEKFKLHIKNTEHKYIAVRRDMLHNYFGFRHASILDLGYGNLTLNNMTPALLKKIILTAEMIIKELVKLVKVDILVKIPIVMFSNVVSNMMWSFSYGNAPWKVLDKTLKNVKNVREYINLHEELVELELAKASGNVLKKDISKIPTIKEKMKKSPIYELDQAGMIQALVEDVSQTDYESSNKIAKKLDEYLDYTPSFVKTGLNWLYLTEKTPYFKFMNNIVQYSDLVARATHNDFLKEKGIGHTERMNTLMDDFVNYNKPASSFEEYLNQMGLVMFTKYMKRIQRALKNFVNKKPLNAFLTVTCQELLFDIDDVTDQLILTRSYKNLDQDMIDQMLGILTPTSYQLITGNK